MTDANLYPSEVIIGGHVYHPVASPWLNARKTDGPVLDENGLVVPFMSREHRLLIRNGKASVPRGFHVTPQGRIWPNKKSPKRKLFKNHTDVTFDDPDDFGIELPRLKASRILQETPYHRSARKHQPVISSDPFLELLAPGSTSTVVYTDPTQVPESSILYQHRGLFKEPKKRRMTQPTIITHGLENSPH